MAIKLQNKQNNQPNMSAMSDLVFLLLIFFMITSTLISPNVISLSLPSSESGRQNLPKNVEIYVDSLKNYYVNPESPDASPVTVVDSILPLLREAVDKREAADTSKQRAIILRSDKSVPIENVVDLMDIVSQLNDERERANKEIYKLALATEGE